MNFAYVDSTFIFGLYDDGTILSGPADARVQRTLLSPTASVFVPDTDTLLALDCGGLWLLPIGSDEPRTRIMTVSTDSRFVTAIDHGFALRRGGKVYVHHGYASEPSDSIEHPETDDYWSVSADGKRSASWGLGPTPATVQWSVGDVETVDLSTNGYTRCAVLSDSVIAAWNSNLFISRDRGLTWHHYRAPEIDPSLPAEEITYRSFRSIEVRGTDIYVGFVPEKLTEMYHYFSSDLGLTWRRYTPATAPVHNNAIPYRAGIASPRNAAGVRLVTDTDGTRIVESLCEIHEAEGAWNEYSIVEQRVSVTDTLYTWSHTLDSCIAFDPGADSTTSWIWFNNGILLTKQHSETIFTERALPTSPLLSCWVVDSVTAIIKGEEGAYVTHDAGATWTADSTYDGLLAFTPLMNETQLSLWRTATAGLEIRSSDSISPNGTLVASLPNTEASQFMISRNGASGCVVQAVGGSEWTSLSIENFTDPGSNEQFSDHMVRFADSLTSRLATGPQLNETTIIPRIHEEHGWVFGISNDAEVGLRQYAIPVGVSESTSIESALSIFPNPAKDLCVIRSTDGTEITSIQVYSSIGTLVLSQTPNGSEAQLDTSTLPAGVYHLSVIGPVIGHTSSRICVTP
ncbi:MAG: T9SS type A sorting domain-containing protein [Ignavibacteria bacterium]|nr:T9SS type A sorting domain-containing protein [Ignavibacteria bacterium]MBL0321553.1 T9SS type A sorting domain-containing protein [Ignavibacteria bacterium]